MKKLLAAMFIMLAAVSISFAGGGKEDSSAPLIGIAMPETHVERWQKDGANLKSAAEARGYRAEVTFGDADQTRQNQQIQNLLTNGAKLLIVGSVNEGVISAVADAAQDSVPVIAYDRIISNSADYDYYITFNNFKVGQFQGQGIEAGLNLKNATAANPKYITLFAGSPTDGNAFFFYDGAMSVLNPYIEKGVLKVVGPYPKTSADRANFTRIATENWQPQIAKARMENLLNNDARSVVLDAVLAPNDTLGRAIIEACLADAKYAAPGKLPVITGQDAEIGSAVSIKNGQQYMTVFKDTNKLAEAAVILADQILKGQTPNIPGAELASGSLQSIGDTGKKVVKAYLLEPILITKDNLNVVVDAGFYTDSEAAQLK
ncbi:sugar ABC transporter substrate-binding protein [Breznakiella homolactica]|uniref:Sugar-binding protein n=1 Tax=Breznakiella homolactica TaxID=2798577 RepID=A0A7T7XR85_9SPIR|nr:sugar-binding protein [Breznakiella homolactica]QQO11024.1 sugar-binding protein [Breznakiella homolactica]